MLMALCSAIVGAIFQKKIRKLSTKSGKIGKCFKKWNPDFTCRLLVVFFFKVKERREDLVAADVVGR